MKEIMKRLVIGMALGSLVLNFILLGLKLSGNTNAIQMILDDYVRQSICSMIVGSVFSLLSMVYSIDALAYSFKVMIHMGIGITIYFIIAYYAKWLPTNQSMGIIVTSMGLMIVLAFLIWGGFHLYHKNEVKMINERIKQKQK